jgi:bifunctional UDP-N-acetylglucosamine pyrophosphorylase/glucosamine-1-phosphate N-acetyltransferase
VEERDADDEIRKITEINSGIYVFHIEDLRDVLPRLTTDNDQKEYYLTDAVRLLVAQGKTVAAWEGDFGEIMGVNTVAELEAAARLLPGRRHRAERHAPDHAAQRTNFHRRPPDKKIPHYICGMLAGKVRSTIISP